MPAPPSPARVCLRLLHVWWPAALGWSVAVVVHRATGRAWQPAGAAFLLLGILAAYSLDRVIDARDTPRWMRRVLGVAGLAAAAGGAWLFPLLPPASRAASLLSAVVALAYPLIKRLPLGKTLLVPLVWTWCGIALPVTGSFGHRWWTEPVAVPLFLLLTAGCLLCDLKDAARDRAAGVPSVPALLGSRPAAYLGAALAVAAGGAAVLTGRPALAWGALALAGLALQPSLVATDDLGPLAVDVILTVPGLLIAAHVV